MAQLTFRHVPLRFDNKKIAEVNQTTFEVISGDEPQFGSDGLLGYSDGATTGRCQFRTVTPVKGHEKDLDLAIYEKKTVVLVLPIGGKSHTLEGRMTGMSYETDARAGTLTGSYTVEGKVSRL